jgi:hypothetical protein
MPKHVPPLPGTEATALPLSQVVEANGFVFLAGQVGQAPGGEGAVPGGLLSVDCRAWYERSAPSRLSRASSGREDGTAVIRCNWPHASSNA